MSEDSSVAVIKKATVTTWVIFERVSKVLTVCIIPILLWGVKVELFMARVDSFIEAGPRYTEKDATLMRKEILGEVNEKLLSQPPEHFRERVERIEGVVLRNQQSVEQMRVDIAEMKRDMAAVLRILDSR